MILINLTYFRICFIVSVRFIEKQSFYTYLEYMCVNLQVLKAKLKRVVSVDTFALFPPSDSSLLCAYLNFPISVDQDQV